MRSEFKSATQIYVNPIYVEILLIFRIDLVLHTRGPDDQNRWNRKNCLKFFHRVIFALWIQICNPYLCKSHICWNIANIQNFCVLNSNLQPIHFEIQLILRNYLFSRDDQNWWNQKNWPKFFHRVISALWIQICNPNLCKSHIFWITANIEKWPFFGWWPKLMKSEKLPEFLS